MTPTMQPQTPPLFLHIGLHKTATSWLQANLFDNADTSPFSAYKEYKDIIAQIILPHENDFDSNAVAAHFSAFIAEAAALDKVAVITSEELGGLPFHKRFVRTELANRLAQSFPGAKVLITIREQSAVILSIYGQFVRYGYHNSLLEFLAEPPSTSGYDGILEYAYYDYDMLLTQYESLFGVGNVIMAPFEIITKTPDWLTTQMGAAISRQISVPPRNLGSRTVNAADAAQSRVIVRQLNRFISRDLRWRHTTAKISPNRIGYKLNNLIPDDWAKKSKARELEIVREAVGSRYAASNRRLAARIGVELDTLGYKI